MNLELARELMVYAANVLKYECPEDVPEIRIEPDLECHGLFRWSIFRPPVISLRDWREGNLEDQATLVHELAHWVQYESGFGTNEIGAITVECRWLQSKGENPRDYMSESSVFKMTGDKEFARLEWL
ncbi:hypothetical protein FHS21_001319 [Phyllobacterium trifolii]|uniref:SprT-like domain-containing protein n=1 Tax=Phyllobacterium trifolii TaxID=300193 RepID=A0A839U2P3_9HYPH|nr:hypothetical protein [Phyllobacterium trifolii]MBB3144918.1 hypothetical protein [Phyllobacterium trifolii]